MTEASWEITKTETPLGVSQQMFPEYHKIETVWARDPATKFRTLLAEEWATPEFAYLRRADWVCEEKVDGTNVRVMWDGERVRFGGKTDNAQLPAPLVERLMTLFYAGALARVLDGPACLYGEGFGPKIQKGGERYADAVDVAIFDVLIGEVWLERRNVADIAMRLECGTPPVVGTMTLVDAVQLVRTGALRSAYVTPARSPVFSAEGLVMRPAVELRTRLGRRVITKIKARDFAA